MHAAIICLATCKGTSSSPWFIHREYVVVPVSFQANPHVPHDDPPRVCGAWGNHIPCELKRNLSIPMLNPTGVCACMGDFSNDSTEMGTSSPWVIHRGDVVSFAPAINENLCSPFFRLFRRILLSFSLHTQHFACHCLYLSFYFLLCNFLLPFRSFLFSEIFAPITLSAIHGFKLS